MLANPVAVSVTSYRQYRDGAFARLGQLGVRYVEFPAPTPDELDMVRARLREHGLAPTTLTCPCDLTTETETIRDRLEACRALGVSLVFISAKSGGLPKTEAYARLRARCELAAEYGVTLSLETHPDLGENATEARATVVGVGHPGLRWNLDTANLYFYNHNLDAVEQTRRGIGLIGSVHLKDTNGGYHAWWFPALGEGVVDFPGVFQALRDADYTGPLTLELEGIQGEALDEELAHARVARSLEYLRGLGLGI